MTNKRYLELYAELAHLQAESATFWNWLAPGQAPSGYKPTEARSLSLVSMVDDGSMALGTLELKKGILTLSANSAARALVRLDQLIQENNVPSQAPLIADTIDLVIHLERSGPSRQVTEALWVKGYSDSTGKFLLEPAG